MDLLQNQYKNVRLSPETYEKLKEIRFFTDDNFIDITKKAIDMYYTRLEAKGELKKR